jgi:hypothetical protein
MHGLKQMAHVGNLSQLYNSLEKNWNDNNIIRTPMYPFDELELDEILEILKDQISKDQNILIHFDTFESGEQNLLFQYYKIAYGTHVQKGLEIFGKGYTHNFTGWNENYQHWSDLQPWEFREWFSIFYPSRINFLLQSPNLVDEDFLKISNSELLYNTKQALKNIVDFCQLTLAKDLDAFVQEWQDAQQYILQEYKMLCKIVECTVKNQLYTWPDLNIIAESIIQQKLRQQGYEIQCNGLNKFPTNSLELHALLEPNWRTE